MSVLLFTYRITIYVVALLAPLYLIYRGLSNKQYLHYIYERYTLCRYPKNCLWVHAASVGEVMVALSFIEHYPDSDKQQWLLTVVTPSGRDVVSSRLMGNVHCRYIPYDAGLLMRLFLARTCAKKLFIIEKELWPNMVLYAAQRNTKICLINARISSRSARMYSKVYPLVAKCLAAINVICVQTPAMRQRLIVLGASSDRVYVTGNIKCDVKLAENPATGIEINNTVPIVFFASTHEIEEEGIRQVVSTIGKEAKYIWAPRHPERFDVVAKMLSNMGLEVGSRAKGDDMKDVLVLDTLGEMVAFMHYAEIVVVGGSFFGWGGQSVIEPALCGKPVISGKSLFNFAYLAQDLIQHEALITVDMEDLTSIIRRLLNDKQMRKNMGLCAKKVILRHKGALDKTYNEILKL